MEFADDTDIEKKILQKIKNKLTFSENEIWSILYQIARGLKCLHDNKILHRDLKPGNVFSFKNGTVKIGDMNVSKIAKNGLLYTQTGTPYYASPEVWKDRPYDNKSDIWSLGCIIYELCCLKPPFRGTTMEGVFSKVIKGVFDPIPHSYSRELSVLISSLLQIKPGTRPSCDQILHIINHNKKLNLDNRNKLTDFEKTILLQTIKFPENINQINDFLPKSNYVDLSSNMTHNEYFLKDGLGDRKKKKISNSIKFDSISKKKDLIQDVGRRNKYSELINQLSNNVISESDKKIDKILEEYHDSEKIKLIRRGRNEDINKLQGNISYLNINKPLPQNSISNDKSINISLKKEVTKYNIISTSPNNNEYRPIIYNDKDMYRPSNSISPNEKYKLLVLPRIVNKRISCNNNISNLETTSKENSSNIINNNSTNLDTETKLQHKQRILSSNVRLSNLSVVPEVNKFSLVDENKSDNIEQKPASKNKRKVPKSALLSLNKANQGVSNSVVLEPWKI
jgi:serine/threonine protein kinase